MRLYLFCGGKIVCDKGIYMPAEKGKMIETPVTFSLIQHPRGNVLFDTGCHPGVVEDPLECWGGLARAFKPVVKQEELAINQLVKAGLRSAEVKYVISSHLHMDHAGGNQFFPRATFVVQKKEIEHAKRDENEGKGYFRNDWDHPLDYLVIDGDYDLFSDGTILLKPLPGHSPGLQVAVVKFPAFSVLLASDSAILQDNLKRNIVPRNSFSAEETLESYRVLRQYKNNGAFIIFGHDPQQWEELALAPEIAFCS